MEIKHLKFFGCKILQSNEIEIIDKDKFKVFLCKIYKFIDVDKFKEIYNDASYRKTIIKFDIADMIPENYIKVIIRKEKLKKLE